MQYYLYAELGTVQKCCMMCILHSNFQHYVKFGNFGKTQKTREAMFTCFRLRYMCQTASTSLQ